MKVMWWYLYFWFFYDFVDVVKLNLLVSMCGLLGFSFVIYFFYKLLLLNGGFVVFQDYYMIIKKFMDMFQIKRKFENYDYFCSQECIDDFCFIFNNCIIYNKLGEVRFFCFCKFVFVFCCEMYMEIVRFCDGLGGRKLKSLCVFVI